MKKILLSLSSAFICQASLFAQITIDSASYTAVFAGTTDSVSIANGSLPALATGPNFSTDLSTISYTIVDTPYMMHNAGPLGYLYADYFHHVISGNLYFNTRPYFNIDAGGFKQYGETIDHRSYGLYGAIPGANNTDSVIFPAQTDVYTSPWMKVQFPANGSGTWSSSFISDVNFTISYATLYNNAPGIYRSIVTEYDTVIGWGKMKVKMADGTPSGHMDVLLVKVNYQEVDSFYIAGGQPDPNLLAAFGLSQGMITTSYEYRYIRPNEVTPLVDVFFVNSNYSNTNVNKTVVHMQRLSIADTSTGVNNYANDKDIMVYPNPLKGNTIFVNTPFADNNISYEVVNILGQNICRGALQTNTAHIDLPLGTSPGLYYLRLNSNRRIYTKTVSILE